MDQLGRAIRQSLDDQRSASRANEPKRGWGGLSAIAADAQQLAESARTRWLTARAVHGLSGA